MGTREDILNAIRRHGRGLADAPSTPPSLEEQWTRFADPQATFIEMVAAVGGQCQVVSSHHEVRAQLAQRPHFQSARRVYCGVEDCVESNVDLAAIKDPHHLEDLDCAVLPGKFCVAENGAVWVTDESVNHRVVYFVVQHLVLVVPADQVVHNMHEAYGRLQLGGAGFGVFISGPSKTADIEQSLVIGAHGPRSLIVFLVEP